MEYDTSENPVEILERQCEEVGVPLSKVIKEAGVDRRNICRWRREEYYPHWKTWNRLQLVIRDYWRRDHGS